jgi:endonuclease I
MTKPNSNLCSLLFLGSLFLIGCQAQDKFCKDPEKNTNCKKVEAKTKEDYYDADFLQSIESLGGNALREKINRSIKKGHVWLNYTPCTWVALQDIDEKNTTNKDEIIPFYSRNNRTIEKKDCQSGSNGKDLWNREHVYPAGRFLTRDEKEYIKKLEQLVEEEPEREKAFAFTDLHHLVASDYSVNSARGKLDFGNVEQDDDIGADDCKDCKKSKDEYWEPGDNEKGQVARILFYMDLRYESESELDLSLVTNKTTGLSFSLGDKTALLKWHCAHNVSDEEITRNNKVQNWQGNRNPFIDYPELVEKIYGKTCDSDEDSGEFEEPSEDDTTEEPSSEEESDITPEVLIISALVNPPGDNDSTKETVTIKNVGVTSVNLKGWTIAGNNNRASPVLLDQDEFILGPGDEYVIVDLGQNGGAQLRNKGNSNITLYDDTTNIINQVTYTTKPSSGENIRFSGDEL